MREISSFNIGDFIKINDIKLNKDNRDKIMSFGFTKNGIIKLIRFGYKKNLIVFEVRGAMVALRCEDCELIFGEIL